MKRTPFDEICRKRMSPQSIRRADKRAEAIARKLLLRDLRKALGVTQKQLADAMGVRQSALSQMENRGDWQLTTLVRVVQALGGELEVTARFRDRSVALQLPAA